jgi:hypothetical protein
VTLADQRHSATSFALSKWRDGWVASKLHTHPAQTIGLYQEKGMTWWVLAKFLHEKKGVPFSDQNIAKWSDSERIENILKIIKAIHLTVEKHGVKEENLTTDEVVAEEEESRAAEQSVAVDEDEGLNSVTIDFMMERRETS